MGNPCYAQRSACSQDSSPGLLHQFLQWRGRVRVARERVALLQSWVGTQLIIVFCPLSWRLRTRPLSDTPLYSFTVEGGNGMPAKSSNHCHSNGDRSNEIVISRNLVITIYVENNHLFIFRVDNELTDGMGIAMCLQEFFHCGVRYYLSHAICCVESPLLNPIFEMMRW